MSNLKGGTDADIDTNRELIKKFSFDDCKLGNQGYNRVLLQLFGLPGNGKSSFINSCIFALGEKKHFENWAKEAKSSGGSTLCRIPYKLTETITMVDNRGMPTLADHETGEIYAQLGNLVPLEEEVKWCKDFNENMKRLVKLNLGSTFGISDFIVPIFVHSVLSKIPQDEKESYRRMLDKARKLTGITPVILLTHKSKGGQKEMCSFFEDLGIAEQKIYATENYTEEDHQKLREKDEQILKILFQIIEDVKFTMRNERVAKDEKEDRLTFVLEYLNNINKMEEKQLPSPSPTTPPPKPEKSCLTS